MRQCLNAETRTESKRSTLRKLRNEGRLPAVVYGNNTDELVIHVSTKDVRKQMISGRTELVDINVKDIGTYPVMLGEIQREPLSGALVHVDFHRIQMDTNIRVKVSISLQGTPEGTKAGGMLQTLETHLEVEGLPANIPPFIEVDISSLAIGDKLTVGDLTAPTDVTFVSDPELLVASIILPRAMKEESDEAEVESEQPVAVIGEEPIKPASE